jgi:hypothetical protein
MIPDGDLHTSDGFTWYWYKLVGGGFLRVSREILDRHRADILTYLNYALEHMPSSQYHRVENGEVAIFRFPVGGHDTVSIDTIDGENFRRASRSVDDGPHRTSISTKLA